jgi:uncharacterized membrane protein
MTTVSLVNMISAVMPDVAQNLLRFGSQDSSIPYLLSQTQSIVLMISHYLGWMHTPTTQLLHESHTALPEISHGIALIILTTQHLWHMLSTLSWIFKNYHQVVMPNNYFESMQDEMKLEAWGMSKARLQKKRPKWWIRSRIKFYFARNYLMNWIQTLLETTIYVFSVVACSILQLR